MKLFSRVEEILSSAGADGNSTTVDVFGFNTVGVALSGGGSTYAAVVTFQGTVDGANWINLLAMNPADGSLQASVTNDSGTYVIGVAGLSGFRLNVSSYSAGNVTGVARRSVAGGGLSFADVEISTELTISELPAVATITDSFAVVDVSQIAAVVMGEDDSGTWNPFKTFRGDSDDLTFADSDSAETLAALALNLFWNSTGAGYDRFKSIDLAADGQTLVLGPNVGAIGLGFDDSGQLSRFKTERYDTDGLAALSSDVAETLAAVAMSYFWNSTGGGWDRLASIDDFSAEGMALGAFPRITAALMGVDDSGTLSRFKTGRADSDWYPADSDNAETLAAIALQYFYNSTSAKYEQIPTWPLQDDTPITGVRVPWGASALLARDDSGDYQRMRSYRSDSDGYAPGSDASENLLANALLWALADDGGWDRLKADDAGRLKVMEDWNSTLQVDETTGDHNKSFAVPADKDWHVMWAWVEWTSNATVGNRQVVMEISDSGSDVIMEIVPGVTQAASLTYKYLFAPGMADLTAVRDTDYIMTPIPPTIILPELFNVRFYDRGDISSAAGEDIQIQMMVMDRGRVDT